MRTGCQLRNTVIGRAARISSEIVGEIVIQIIRLVRITVDDELQIMPDTTSCSIDSVLIFHLSHKERRRVHVSTIHEGRRIEITVDRRTDGVILCQRTSTHIECVARTMSTDGPVIVDGIEIDQSRFIRIVDVLRHGKLERELASHHAVRTIIEGLGAVVESESITCAIVLSAGNQFLGISYRSRHHTVESFISLNMSVDSCHHSCFQHSLGRSIRSRNAIHRIYHYFQCWHIQRHCRVA